jgi:hypothetical protein
MLILIIEFRYSTESLILEVVLLFSPLKLLQLVCISYGPGHVCLGETNISLFVTQHDGMWKARSSHNWSIVACNAKT